MIGPARSPYWAARITRRLITPAGLGAVALLCLLCLAVLMPRMIAPYDPFKIQSAQTLLPPNLAHPAGTDVLGRDVISQVAYGLSAAAMHQA